MIRQTASFCSEGPREQYHVWKKEFADQHPRPDTHCRDLWKLLSHEDWLLYSNWQDECEKKIGSKLDPLCAICIWRQEDWDKKEKDFLLQNFKANHECEICDIDPELIEIAANVWVKKDKE